MSVAIGLSIGTAYVGRKRIGEDQGDSWLTADFPQRVRLARKGTVERGFSYSFHEKRAVTENQFSLAFRTTLFIQY
ncbi:long-chain fatty acid transporter [Sporosarcina newyorkensis 2681]|uniref:Long-chain fatty acid transporter n=1 Tax=Sporosarcina newyorkensis 2681 TaxID=1027292 RepID=F9DPR2_9BACL|nr:long-chain fatty acid transporter [Sporosarcina newyorkensis 2681]